MKSITEIKMNPYSRSNAKKGVMPEVIGLFVLVLVVAVIAGMTFLFTASLKTQVQNSSPQATYRIGNESGWLNSSGYILSNTSKLGFNSPAILIVLNNLTNPGATTIPALNYSISSAGVLTNATPANISTVFISYTYSSIENLNGYTAVNSTEAAGAGIVTYLPLLFLAMIFGVILTVTLRIILPYINLGSQSGGTGF